MKTLILGGVRSGKSRLAEKLATGTGMHITYLATATASDAEMQTRIEEHRRHRPEDWLVIEEPLHLTSVLSEHADVGRCMIIDCLTLWLTNCLMADDITAYEQERDAFFEILDSLQGEIIMVSNETNMGVMPLGNLTRVYCDEAGKMHQILAQISERVILTVAGLPHVLKGEQK